MKKYNNFIKENKENMTMFLIDAIKSYVYPFKGNYENVEYAINNGANVNDKINGKTPLDFLIEQEVTHQGYYVNWEKSNLIKIAKLLVKNGAKFKNSDIVHIFDLQYNLSNIPEIENSNKLISLILKTNIDINYADENGKNALMSAIYSDTAHSHESNSFYNLKIIEKIIQHNIDLTHKDNDGKTFIEYVDYHNKKQAKKLKAKIEFILFNNKNLSNVQNWYIFKNSEKYNL